VFPGPGSPKQNGEPIVKTIAIVAFAALAIGITGAELADRAEPQPVLADGGDYVVTNQQTADAGDYVVTNRQLAEVDNGLWQENQANRKTADAGDYVVTNQRTADAGDYVGTTPGAAGGLSV
jgi:hypothetical protein